MIFIFNKLYNLLVLAFDVFAVPILIKSGFMGFINHSILLFVYILHISKWGILQVLKVDFFFFKSTNSVHVLSKLSLWGLPVTRAADLVSLSRTSDQHLLLLCSFSLKLKSKAEKLSPFLLFRTERNYFEKLTSCFEGCSHLRKKKEFASQVCWRRSEKFGETFKCFCRWWASDPDPVLKNSSWEVFNPLFVTCFRRDKNYLVF